MSSCPQWIEDQYGEDGFESFPIYENSETRRKFYGIPYALGKSPRTILYTEDGEIFDSKRDKDLKKYYYSRIDECRKNTCPRPQWMYGTHLEHSPYYCQEDEKHNRIYKVTRYEVDGGPEYYDVNGKLIKRESFNWKIPNQSLSRNY